MIGWTLDDMVMVPYSVMSTFINTNGGGDGDPLLAVKPKPGIPGDELKYEVKGVMRSVRRLSPIKEDNFAINQMSMITDQISSLFIFVNLAGLLIGGFSILVGGFGIANIMFVTVKERTKIIGLKKAIGARRSSILLEFLLESVVLCLIGGLIGIFIVLLLTLVVKYGFDLEVTLSVKNFLVGVFVSIFVGVLSGFLPARTASKLDAVVAIRSN